ncbi:hypothetical protein DS031_09690 [Bacillus taeanensis]|uniref:Polysaccharide biosynthesis protein C-terminal domain-containing protein n=1 Tax=Bacillus taeanensis TaxID=273032 RepID=A0A366Y066_9BACI|nr:hypothetical protein DS031_09690 [Bacillus taeanensis]
MISHTKITQSMSMIVFQILGGYLLTGPFPLLLGDALGRMSGSSRFVFSILKEDAVVFKKVNRLNIKKMALRYKKFPLYSSFSALIRQVSLEIPAILLMFIYGPSVVGSFIIAQRILTLPLFLIGMSVENVFFSEVSLLLHTAPNKIKELFLKTLKHFFIILPIMIGLSIFSPWLFPMLFGSEWTESGRYVPLLASMYFFQFLVTPFSSIVYFLERQDLQFLREVLRILFIAIAFTYIMFQQVSSLHAIAIMSAAGSIGFILYGYLSWLGLMQFEKQKKFQKKKPSFLTFKKRVAFFYKCG